MKIKYFSSLFASIAIACALTPAFATSTNETSQTISCQVNGETPTTIAKRTDGKELTIFHWRNDVLPDNLDPHDLCEDVSAKLQNYAVGGHQLSLFKTYDMENIPLICAYEDATGDCSLVLFSLNATNSQREGNMILREILDDSLKGEETISVQRGVQFYGYKVSFWNLLGF